MNKPLNLKTKAEDIPEGWDLIDSLVESRAIGDCQLHLRGYACQRRSDQKIVTGSWAGWDEPLLDKARLELYERLAIMQALDQAESKVWPLMNLTRNERIGLTRGSLLFPQSPNPQEMQYAKSNGVALGINFQDAALRAASEVIERHLVLSSWYGAIRPQACVMQLPPALESLQELYDFQCYDFGWFDLKDIGRVHARGCFLWPVRPDHPVIYGFGAAADTSEATFKALSEAVQRLAFLDPIELPSCEPTFAPSPDFHQEYFLHPARRSMLDAWLRGTAAHPHFSVDISLRGEGQAIDLTPTGPCPGTVVRVMLPEALPLVFGRFQPQAFPELPERFWIHPIV